MAQYSLFTKKQLIEGYLDFKSEDLSENLQWELQRVYLASVCYHGLNSIHEDMICDSTYLYFDKGDSMVMINTEILSEVESKKKLSLWDLV